MTICDHCKTRETKDNPVYSYTIGVHSDGVDAPDEEENAELCARCAESFIVHVFGALEKWKELNPRGGL
jgi:hypothetical protein